MKRRLVRMVPGRAYALFLVPVFSLWAAEAQAKNAGLEAGPSTFLNNLTDEERAWLQEHPVIRVVQDPGWPPVEFADEQGNPSGMSMDYPFLIQASLFVAGILLLMIFWNRKLAREVYSRRHAEEALRESERTLRESQLIAGIGSYVLDIPSGTWKSSEVLDAILGLTHVSDHTLKGWAALVHPDDREALSEAFQRNVLEQGMNYNREYRIIRPDTQEERWIHVLGRIERGPDGKPLRLHGTIQDITGRKHAELEKTHLEAQLLQAQKMESVGRLAGGVAHDFNNMLGVIMGHTELAIEYAAAQPALKADLLEIRSAAERSVNLTRQLLAFARKQTIAPVLLNLNKTVAGMLSMLQRLIGEDIGLNWHPQDELWPVRIDPSQVDQLLANLCVNARDAIHNVGAITIETGNRTLDADYCGTRPGFKPGDFVQLSVSDNGSGIDPESMSHLFEPFFTTKATGQGTGLGLATVYGIVKQNNGFINVYSEPGQGTTFTIYLPRHDGIPESIPVAEAPDNTPQGRETILLVEDETMLLQLTHAMLRRMGYTVLAAGSPGEAVTLARTYSEPIHLLITDVVMPEMNGRDLAGVIQTIQPGISLLFMSGYTANVIAHHGVLDEGVHFIQKPFSRKDLSKKIRKALET